MVSLSQLYIKRKLGKNQLKAILFFQNLIFRETLAQRTRRPIFKGF